MNDIHLRAAQARSAGIAQRADRPSQRRALADISAPSALVAAATLDLRAAGEEPATLLFTGYASVYDRGYEMYDAFGPYTEIVEAGAGAATLNRADLDVPLLIQHGGMPLARTTNGTLRLSEDATGLLVDADLDPTDRDVDYIATKIRSGLVNEMSFAFRITRGEWSPDYTEYRIKKYDIHRGDVAIVRYGANPFTGEGHMGLRSEDTSAPTVARRGRDLITAADLAPLPINLQA